MPTVNPNQSLSCSWFSSSYKDPKSVTIDGARLVSTYLDTSEDKFILALGLDVKSKHVYTEWEYGDSDKERQLARDDFKHMMFPPALITV